MKKYDTRAGDDTILYRCGMKNMNKFLDQQFHREVIEMIKIRFDIDGEY